jgi:L-alanine-DL-glutamate epimerase-like enolase superfamily enzyme
LKPLIGRDPREIERITNDLYTATRQSPFGLNQQAIGAIQNALIDIKAKSLNIPVYELFGGPLRKRIPLYWSHFALYRLRRGFDTHQKEEIKDLAQMAAHAKSVVEQGYSALKTKIHCFDETGGTGYFPCFGSETGAPELNLSPSMLKNIVNQMAAIREAVGDELDLILDLNSNFKPDGIIRISKALKHLGIRWLEVDVFDADILRDIREKSPISIGGCEMLCNAKSFAPFFSKRSVDVPLVDVSWNGLLESIKIANVADVFDLNISPHNFTGYLATQISAHFAAITPNLEIMEFDVDEVPWLGEFFTEPLKIEGGELILSEKPGWGMDIDEKAVLKKPPRTKLD